jgi:endonuclease/exonuclease/phosphatase (EEP) superfamily protein YafD
VTVERAWRGLGVVALVGCWLAVAGLALCALGRLVSYDQHRIITLLDANTFWLYLPAYVIVIGALLFRRSFLAGAAAVLVVLHMVWVVPTFTHRRAIPAAARHAPHLRVLSANLRFDNNRKDDLAAEIARSNADVLLLQEVTPMWWQVLGAHGVLRRYPSEVHQFDEHAGGEAILARRPLVDTHVYDAGGWPLISATTSTARGAVRLFDVHPQPPAFIFNEYRRMTHAITGIVKARLRDGTPTIVAGDFNSTPYNRWLHTMLGLGLHSAHEDRGRPLAFTWPNGLHKFPPLRIDHMLMTDTLVTLAVREGRGAGSDHRPVIGDIAVLG